MTNIVYKTAGEVAEASSVAAGDDFLLSVGGQTRRVPRDTIRNFAGIFADIATMAASEALSDGQDYSVTTAANGQPETFTYNAASTATADGALIVTATGMGAGRLISKRTVYATVAEMLADNRTFADGVNLMAGGYPYITVSASPHLTLAGGQEVQVISEPDGAMNAAAFGCDTSTADNSASLAALYAASPKAVKFSDFYPVTGNFARPLIPHYGPGGVTIGGTDIPLNSENSLAPVSVYVSPTGDNDNHGLSAAYPFRHIQRAFDSLPRNVAHRQDIVLADGTHTGNYLPAATSTEMPRPAVLFARGRNIAARTQNNAGVMDGGIVISSASGDPSACIIETDATYTYGIYHAEGQIAIQGIGIRAGATADALLASHRMSYTHAYDVQLYDNGNTVDNMLYAESGGNVEFTGTDSWIDGGTTAINIINGTVNLSGNVQVRNNTTAVAGKMGNLIISDSASIQVTGDTDGSTGTITNVTGDVLPRIGDWVTVSTGFPSATDEYKVTAVTATTITVDENSTSAQTGATVAVTSECWMRDSTNGISGEDMDITIRGRSTDRALLDVKVGGINNRLSCTFADFDTAATFDPVNGLTALNACTFQNQLAPEGGALHLTGTDSYGRQNVANNSTQPILLRGGAQLYRSGTCNIVGASSGRVTYPSETVVVAAHSTTIQPSRDINAYRLQGGGSTNRTGCTLGADNASEGQVIWVEGSTWGVQLVSSATCDLTRSIWIGNGTSYRSGAAFMFLSGKWRLVGLGQPRAGLQTYSATNVTTSRSFDADTVTVAALADIVGTLIADLRNQDVVL